MVSVSPVPSNYRVPLATFTIEPSQAVFQTDNTLLLIGHKTAAGTMNQDEAYLVSDDVRGLTGVGSMLAEMYDIAKSNAPYQRIAIASVAEAAGAAATATITVAGAPVTENTTIYWYINGKRYMQKIVGQ